MSAPRSVLAAVLVVAVAAGASAAPRPASRTLPVPDDRLGPGWQVTLCPSTGRPRSLSGGALPWLDADERAAPPLAKEPWLLERARAFLVENADLLGIDAAHLRPSARLAVVTAGAVDVAHFDVVMGGARLEDAHVALALSHGSLVYVHVVGSEPVEADTRPSIDPQSAETAAAEAAGAARGDLRAPTTELVLVRQDASARLAWRVDLTWLRGPRRMVAHVDARTGDVLSLTDETVAACDPVPPSGPERRALGGVRPESADDAERVELLARVRVGGALSGVDGFFAPPPAPYAATLDGLVRIECVDCTNPPSPLADASASGDADFGIGGADAAGNGFATPSDRTAAFHAEGVKRLASRWLALPFVTDPLVVRTNIPSSCNAYWDGSSLNFFRSSARCANTGEIRDVIDHEWGHGLDDNDGQEPAGLSVDAATGEGVADLVALVRSRDACIGESFFASAADWPSATCSGVRDLDELSSGHEHGSPGTLSTTNVAAKCSASAFYRGVLGREGHCEGEILGQAAWHLAQDLLAGVSYADGSAIGAALPEEAAWQVLEALVFGSRPLMASYAPSSLQSLGTSAYDAFLVADDTGDGLGNGTPHAAFIHEAFAHHGLEEGATAPPMSPPCAPLPDPVVTTSAPTDPGSGLPAVRLDWTDVGAFRTHVLRADDPDDAFLPLAPPLPAGASSFVDRGVLPGRGYRYRVVAENASGCLSPGAAPVTGAAGPLLRVATAVIDDTVGGNGDFLLEEGEEADVRLDLANDGSGEATNVSVSLAATDPRLAVTDPGPIAYGRIGAGALVVGPSTFHVRADAGVPRRIFLVASGEADQGCLRAQWQLEIAVVDLEPGGQRATDVTGDADGAWEPGERAELQVDLRNVGLLDAPLVDGTIALRAPVPGVTIAQDTAAWGSIAGGATGATGAPHFLLDAAPGLGPRTPVPLDLTVRVAGAPHRTFPLDLSVGGMPPGQIEWTASGSSSPTPLVLQLTDDDGDDAITRCDVPEIVCARVGLATIAAYSGDSGALVWEVPTDPCGAPGAFDSIAGGDVDGDGDNDIVWGDDDSWVCALDHDGTLLWKSAAQVHSHWSSGSQPQLWDLDGDGTIEVVAGRTALNGLDGSVAWDNTGWVIGRDLVGDLDLDGKLEVICSDSATYRSDGTPYPTPGGGFMDNLVPGGLVNMDSDPYPEVVSLGAGGAYGTVHVFEHDGTPKWQRADLPGGGQGPPCFGDFDRDGFAEVAIATETSFHVLDDDGSTAWSVPVFDASGASGCSVFDFDADGPPEIVYRDEQFLRVFDGLTGETLWSTPVSSGTAFEFPYVADVDGDGLAEILVTGGISGRIGQVHAFGNAAWPSGRGIWNQEDYQVSNVEEDGTVVSNPFPRWLSKNDFRGQESVCPCTGPEPSFTLRSDCDRTTCFTATVAGGRSPFDLAWDFGDGTTGSGPTPCHVFPGAGDYPVRLSTRDANGCVVESGQVVRVREALAVSVVADVRCVGTDSCLTATVTGGLPAYDLEWDFDDGSPAASGPTACHAFAAGSFVVSAFVRDARGCLAEAATSVIVDDPAMLPEVSGRAAPVPLTVRKAPAASLALDFEATGRDASLYSGDVNLLVTAGYTHESTGTCRRVGASLLVPEPAGDRYFLVVGSGCDPVTEGPYGFDSLGGRRPSAVDLGRPACP